jgi:hypothetical protein
MKGILSYPKSPASSTEDSEEGRYLTEEDQKNGKKR